MEFCENFATFPLGGKPLICFLRSRDISRLVHICQYCICQNLSPFATKPTKERSLEFANFSVNMNSNKKSQVFQHDFAIRYAVVLLRSHLPGPSRWQDCQCNSDCFKYQNCCRGCPVSYADARVFLQNLQDIARIRSFFYTDFGIYEPQLHMSDMCHDTFWSKLPANSRNKQ